MANVLQFIVIQAGGQAESTAQSYWLVSGGLTVFSALSGYCFGKTTGLQRKQENDLYVKPGPCSVASNLTGSASSHCLLSPLNYQTSRQAVQMTGERK